MNLLIVILWILLAISLCETVYGIYKKTGVLITIGVLVALMCALGLILATGYADSITITGEGMMV